MSTSLQASLLRVLEEKTFESVGGTNAIKLDTRFLSAANRDPRQGVREGWFRADLLYRLNVIEIQLPPLRDHKEDIPLLIEHFLERYSHKNRKHILGFSNAAFEALLGYSFPGNTRELKNIIERAVILTKEKEITVRDLPEHVTNGFKPCRAETTCRHVNGDELLKALKEITISNNGGAHKKWHRTLQCISIEMIYEFLVKTYNREFSRIEFTSFLDNQSGSDRNKYGTAGKYLAVLKNNKICVHNDKKANQSRFRLSGEFIIDSPLN